MEFDEWSFRVFLFICVVFGAETHRRVSNLKEREYFEKQPEVQQTVKTLLSSFREKISFAFGAGPGHQENCVNKGKVSGLSARGISNVANETNNVVSLGIVNGSNGTYLLWDAYNTAETIKCYGVEDACETCNDSFSFLHRYEQNGRHCFMTENDGKLTRVNEILNKEAHHEGYKMYWTRNLGLSDYLNVHVIDLEEKEHETKMMYDDSLNSMRLLKCLVVDRETNETYSDDYKLKRDLMLQMKKAETVVIEIQPIEASEVNESELIEIIADTYGIDKKSFQLKMEINENGDIVRVTILVEDEKTADRIVNEMNNIVEKKPSDCTQGTLCRATDAYVKNRSTSMLSIEEECQIELSIFVFILCITLTTFS